MHPNKTKIQYLFNNFARSLLAFCLIIFLFSNLVLVRSLAQAIPTPLPTPTPVNPNPAPAPNPNIPVPLPTPGTPTPAPALAPGTPPAPAPAPKPQPVDESNVIFLGCRVSALQGLVSEVNSELSESDEGGIPEQNSVNRLIKQKFLTDCVQDIIRFVIIITVLAVVLRIAAFGVTQILPQSGIKNNPVAVLRDAIIGIFLLLVGWNLIFILNNSFINVEVLDLPAITYCKIDNGCLSKEQKFEIDKRLCVFKLNNILEDKVFTEGKDVLAKLKACLEEICKSTQKFNTFKIDFCKEKFGEKIDQVIKEGPKLGGNQSPIPGAGGSSGNSGGGSIPGGSGGSTPGVTPSAPGSSGSAGVPDSDLIAKAVALHTQGKFILEDRQLGYLKQGLNKPNVLRLIIDLASNPRYKSVGFSSLVRLGILNGNSRSNHLTGNAADLTTIVLANGQKFDKYDVFTGKVGAKEAFLQLAQDIRTCKCVRRIITYTGFLDDLSKQPGYSSNRDGNPESIGTMDTPNGGTSSTRHEDHYHIDVVLQ